MVSRGTLICLALALAALVATLRFLPTGTASGYLETVAAPSFDAGGVVSATFRFPDGRTASLRRDPTGEWSLSAPDSGRADRSRIEMAVEAAFSGPVRDRVSPRQRKARGLTLADFGFGQDGHNPGIEARTSSGAHIHLLFGDWTPSGSAVFARDATDASQEDTGDVLVLDRAARAMLPSELDDLRDRVLLGSDSGEMTAVEIRRPGEAPVRLEADASGALGWRLASPYRCPADPAAADALVAALRAAVADRFIWTPPAGAAPSELQNARAAAGLAPGEIAVSLTAEFDGGRSKRSFAFAGPDPASPRELAGAALDDGTVFRTDSTLFEALRIPADALRERRVFPLSADDCLSLSLSSPDFAADLVRNAPDDRWRLEAPFAQPADQEAANAFVSGLFALHDQGAEPSAIDFKPPQGAVRVSAGFASPGSSSVVWFWNTTDETPRAWLPDCGMILQFAEKDVPVPALAPEKLAALRDRHVFSADPDDISSLSLRTTESPLQSVRRDATGAWVQGPDAPPGFVPDSLAADAAATALASLEATSVLALSGADSAALGLLPPRTEWIIARKAPPAPLGSEAGQEAPVSVLQLGAPLPDGTVPMRIKGLDTVFTLDAAKAAILQKPILVSNSAIAETQSHE